MSKTIIKIESLTINLSAGESKLPGGLIAAILSRAAERAGEPRVEGATTEQSVGEAPAAAEASPPTSSAPTANDVLAFLNSDPRYTMRSFASVSERFDAASDELLQGLLGILIDQGKVTTKRRRSDGATLYQALAHAEASDSSTAAPGNPELTEHAIRSFLGSDDRYTQRSVDAIAKHFGVDAGNAQLLDLLHDMVDNGDIEQRTRRRDGAALYELA